MRQLKDLTPDELMQLHDLLQLTEEKGKPRFEYEYNTWAIESDNDYGVLYKIYEKGAIVAICKDDNSERSYWVDAGKVVKALYDMGIDLLGINEWKS
jgi:hypothetical protein